eukprot:jgi/Bigna1/87550/estExt_fgenesh1_pg.C_210172
MGPGLLLAAFLFCNTPQAVHTSRSSASYNVNEHSILEISETFETGGNRSRLFNSRKIQAGEHLSRNRTEYTRESPAENFLKRFKKWASDVAGIVSGSMPDSPLDAFGEGISPLTRHLMNHGKGKRCYLRETVDDCIAPLDGCFWTRPPRTADDPNPVYSCQNFAHHTSDRITVAGMYHCSNQHSKSCISPKPVYESPLLSQGAAAAMSIASGYKEVSVRKGKATSRVRQRRGGLANQIPASRGPLKGIATQLPKEYELFFTQIDQCERECTMTDGGCEATCSLVPSIAQCLEDMHKSLVAFSRDTFQIDVSEILRKIDRKREKKLQGHRGRLLSEIISKIKVRQEEGGAAEEDPGNVRVFAELQHGSFAKFICKSNFRRAVRLVANHYEGSTVAEASRIVDERYGKRSFWDDDYKSRMLMLMDGQLRRANKVFESNKIGQEMWKFEGVSWAVEWLLYKTLEIVEHIQKGPNRAVFSNNFFQENMLSNLLGGASGGEGGIGFVAYESELLDASLKEKADVLNHIIKTAPDRVRTSMAYHVASQTMRKFGKTHYEALVSRRSSENMINRPLIKRKLRPIGWPLLKYYGWNVFGKHAKRGTGQEDDPAMAKEFIGNGGRPSTCSSEVIYGRPKPQLYKTEMPQQSNASAAWRIDEIGDPSSTLPSGNTFFPGANGYQVTTSSLNDAWDRKRNTGCTFSAGLIQPANGAKASVDSKILCEKRGNRPGRCRYDYQTQQCVKVSKQDPESSPDSSQTNGENSSSKDSWPSSEDGEPQYDVTMVSWGQQQIDKNLPMFSGPSSTTSAMYELARILGLSKHEMPFFRLLMLVWMIQGRDHSFTEIMGAFDAYDLAGDENFRLNSQGLRDDVDELAGWPARKHGTWHMAFRELIPGGKMTLKNLWKVLGAGPHGKCFPDYYYSKEWTDLLLNGFHAEKHQKEPMNVPYLISQSSCQLAADSVAYCEWDQDSLTLRGGRFSFSGSKPESANYLDKHQRFQFCKHIGENLLDRENEQHRAARGDLFNLLHLSSAEHSMLTAYSHPTHLNPLYDVFERLTWGSGLARAVCQLLPSLEESGRTKKQQEEAREEDNCFYRLIDDIQRGLISTVSFSEKLIDHPHAACSLVEGIYLAVIRFYTMGNEGSDVLNAGYFEGGGRIPPLAVRTRATEMFKKKINAARVDPAVVKRLLAEREVILRIMQEAVLSPIFFKMRNPAIEEEFLQAKGNTAAAAAAAATELSPLEDGSPVWHGCIPSVAQALIRTSAAGQKAAFPGFMSTSYSPTASFPWAMMKGHLLQIEGAEMAAVLGVVSTAPSEEEALMPEGTLYEVGAVCHAYWLTSQGVGKRVFVDTALGADREPKYPEWENYGECAPSSFDEGEEIVRDRDRTRSRTRIWSRSGCSRNTTVQSQNKNKKELKPRARDVGTWPEHLKQKLQGEQEVVVIDPKCMAFKPYLLVNVKKGDEALVIRMIQLNVSPTSAHKYSLKKLPGKVPRTGAHPLGLSNNGEDLKVYKEIQKECKLAQINSPDKCIKMASTSMHMAGHHWRFHDGKENQQQFLNRFGKVQHLVQWLRFEEDCVKRVGVENIGTTDWKESWKALDSDDNRQNAYDSFWKTSCVEYLDQQNLWGDEQGKFYFPGNPEWGVGGFAKNRKEFLEDGDVKKFSAPGFGKNAGPRKFRYQKTMCMLNVLGTTKHPNPHILVPLLSWSESLKEDCLNYHTKNGDGTKVFYDGKSFRKEFREWLMASRLT